MKNYYCFPDIHGCSNLLQKALDFVYNKNQNGGKIIFLGDYIDRGPDNLGVLQIVMNPPEGWEFITLFGNHEAMFIDSYFDKKSFYDIKAAKEIAGFNKNEFAIYDHIHARIDKRIVDWMCNLSILHIEDKNVFAHAFYDDTLDSENQIMDHVIWKRMDDYTPFQNDKQGLYLTHGHTPRAHGPVKSPNRVNLDCGAVFYGRYVIGEYAQGVQEPIAFHEFFE
jgi:serine/threonine protein phosphatase 1